MLRQSRLSAIVLLISLLVLHGFGPVLSAQTALPSPEELDQLLAPVALYPDSLLSQITTASTNPQEILDVDNWLQDNSGLTGTALTDAAQQQGFDPAFIALVNFPQVLEMMAQHVDVVHFAIRNVHKSGDIAAQVQQRMHLDRGLAPPKARPRKQPQTQIDGSRI